MSASLKISEKNRIALFASGTGTNAIKLLEQQAFLKNTTIPILIVDRTDSPLPAEVQKKFPQVKVAVIPAQKKTGQKKTKEEHEDEILTLLREHQVNWCFLAGYMRIVGPTLLRAFENRIVNIHPSILPEFPGLDAYRQAFEANTSKSGITVHLVDDGVDTGPILAQSFFSRAPGDTLEKFIERGKALEWKLYPEVLHRLDQEGILSPTHQALIAIPTAGEHRFSLFWIRYSGKKIENAEFKKISPLVSDEVDQQFWVNPTEAEWSSLFTEQDSLTRLKLQIVRFNPGVTDNPAHSFHELLAFHFLFKDRKFQVHSGEAILVSAKQEPIAANRLIQNSLEFASPGPKGHELNQLFFSEAGSNTNQVASVRTFDIQALDANELEALSQKQFWALSRDEMIIIQNHFKTLGRSPTDVEIEVLAQTWSEHCKHKIFAATIDYQDDTESFQVQSLFKTYIEKPTTEIQKKKDWAISVFKDNAGIVRFHEKVDLCIKVETHNSPSALDPYGGALTGILGVNRDILGTGLGARPIANTNVLCFGEPNETHELPKGLLHPKTVFEGVHKGIQDGGNKSGIPTINGAILFDECYSGKPLVYAGTVGVLPREIQGIPSASKNQIAGDLIVMVGGAVGADGLHGATSSSLALDHTTPSTMVQIGDPLTQKRVLDFIIEARDLNLYSSITDNGAGGLSSSIGEMSEKTNGAKVQLDQVPLKYPGLLPWQILLSESQERMTLSVPKVKIQKLQELARARNVAATVVGEFNASGFFEICYGSETIGKINLNFLHHGLPKMKLKAKWNGPQKRTSWKSRTREKFSFQSLQENLARGIETLVSDPSLASKEKWIRQYDHEVQAATVIKPFEGMFPQTAPNDGGVIWMGAHGNPGFSGAAVASGICPDFSLIDGSLMAQIAADEAVRNLIVTGVDPNKIALIDNFCWPDPLVDSKNPAKNPDAEHKLAQLVRTCRGLADLVRTYEMPLVSGKDSMKNDFVGRLSSGQENGKEVKISVLPTLLVTALGYHPDVRRVVKSHAKPGALLYVLSAGLNHSPTEARNYFGASLPKYFDLESAALPTWNLSESRALYEKFFQTTQAGRIKSAHDLSEGGLLFALFETLLLHGGGIDLAVPDSGGPHAEIGFCFGEEPSRILVSVDAADRATFQSQFEKQAQFLGTVNSSGKINLIRGNKTETIKIADLAQKWRTVL